MEMPPPFTFMGVGTMSHTRTFEWTPWKWHPRSAEREHNGSVYAEPIQGHAYAVAVQPRYVKDQEWRVHASLIAAAPELLALVKRYRAETPLGNQPSMIAEEADRIIAKAEGRAP